MKKRLAACLLAFCLLFGCAAAQEMTPSPIATYTLPRGAEALHVWDSTVWDIPEGLEDMYRIMQTVTVAGDVYLVRIPHGRALVSVSCTEPSAICTADELLARWPQIAQAIAKEGVSVNADESCASVREAYGFESLSIETTIGLGELGTGLQLDAKGTAFMRGSELIEVWSVVPAKGSYADAAEAEELEADRVDLAAFMQSLNFTDLTSLAVEGVPYQDPDRRFALVIPAGCTVITKATPKEEIESARQAYLAAHGAGAEAFFNEYVKDATEQNVVIVIAQDQQMVAEIFADQLENFRDVPVDQLHKLAEPIRQSLAKKFEVALLLTDAQQAVISGRRHCWLGYWLRNGEVNAQMDVLATVLDDAWLYEIDLITHANAQDARSLWHMFVTQTMLYTPPSNALD